MAASLHAMKSALPKASLTSAPSTPRTTSVATPNKFWSKTCHAARQAHVNRRNTAPSTTRCLKNHSFTTPGCYARALPPTCAIFTAARCGWTAATLCAAPTHPLTGRTALASSPISPHGSTTWGTGPSTGSSVCRYLMPLSPLTTWPAPRSSHLLVSRPSTPTGPRA